MGREQSGEIGVGGEGILEGENRVGGEGTFAGEGVVKLYVRIGS